MNTPYVKQFNELGELLNPIDGALRHKSSNRRARHAKKERDFNNKKSYSLVVVGNSRFRKRAQRLDDRVIVHYDEVKKWS